MVVPINPEGERIRAQAILRSFTEYDEAVELFAPKGPQVETTEPAELAANANRSTGPFFARIFKAIKRDRRVADESVQKPAYSPRQVTTSGCS